MPSPLVIAHRGNSSVVPENTVAALVSAARAGADLFEIDLQMTTDGVGVVFHDHPLGRTAAASGLLRELDLEAVQGLEVGSWFDPAWAGTPVPVWDDVLAVLERCPATGLLLEVSGPWRDTALAEVLTSVVTAGLGDRVIVQSFSLASLHTAQRVAPELSRGLLTATWPQIAPLERTASDPDSVIDACLAVGARWCNPIGSVLTEHPDAVPVIHRQGLQTMVWTLNEPAEWLVASAATVDGIITDRPDRLVGWLAGHGSAAQEA